MLIGDPPYTLTKHFRAEAHSLGAEARNLSSMMKIYSLRPKNINLVF
jgi:hypothetical protein